jgi:hypothetical protein
MELGRGVGKRSREAGERGEVLGIYQMGIPAT